MSEIIASELKSWFLTLKFEDKDLSTEQIEEEFRRLSPPELRDIWRNIMIHVVPVKEARYIKKVLLLHELNKLKANKEKTYFIPKTVKSLKDFDQFKSCEETFSRLKKCHDDIAKHENEITAFKAKVTSKEMERAKFLNKKEKLDHIHILNDLKISEREKTIRDLLELHAYLNYVNSFWRTEKNSKEDGKDRLDIIKECLRNVNEFSKQRNILPESNLLREKENLMNNIVRLTSNIPISSLHKMVIEMLKEKLSSLLKLADHVNSKQNTESSWLSESKLTELKKECVQYFFKNFDKRKHLQNLHNEIETYKLELFDAMTYNNYVGFQKETFETWLESECQKQRLVTRENYLRKEFDAIKNKIDKVVNFSNQTERNEFFTSNADSNVQIVLALDQEIMSNIIHLSNEPIDMFISCQQYCTSRIDGFIKEQKSEKLKNFINDCIQSSTNNELSEFKQLELQAILNNIAILETNKHDLSDYYITFCTEQCYYIIYFTDRYNNMTAKFGQLVVKPESLYEKKVQILKDQEKFLSIIQKSIHEAKSNLKNVEKYASECSKNIGLWIDLSVNDIIPKGTNMMVANREFVDWLKRYVSVIQSLRKKSNKSSNL